jgi:type IV secretory pathway TrbF-like protein/sugar phosphate permease
VAFHKTATVPLGKPTHVGSSIAETTLGPALPVPIFRATPRLPVPTWPQTSRRLTANLTHSWRLIAFVFLPFAAGYYLSYLYRTINALISGQLTSDLALGAADLGLLTSVYFLTFAVAQIPIGVLLDRYGPRRVQSALLLIAAAGAALFGTSETFMSLVFARAMIGLGVAAALTAGLKAIVLWFPRERVALVNGYMIMLGALGAVTATAPADLLLGWTGWRGLFELLAAATAGSALLIYFAVPEPLASSPKNSAPASLKTVYADSRFWQLAPLSATCVGSAWALQGLWAAPWLTDVEGFDRTGLITHLFVMAVALSAGAFLLGTIADRMRRRGIGPRALLTIVATVFMAAQLALILRLPLPSYLPWPVIAAVGAGTVLSYAIVADYFPKEVAGRANGALNVFHLGWAFVLQYATGLVLEQWTSQDGHYPAIAYQVAFGLNLALQIAALAWFEAPRLRTLRSALASQLIRSPLSHGKKRNPLTPYEKAAHAWAERVGSARAQARAWRFAALGSTSLSALLGLALAISAGFAEVTPYVLQVDRLNEAGAANPPVSTPSDAQIAYFLARFIKNVRSLSTDPIVVRANWMDALNYVTDQGALTLDDYARDAATFMKIGSRPITVEVIYLVRASGDSFEIRWQEQTYENGAIVKTERLTGIAAIIFKPPSTAAALRKNPLGLYVRAFNWSRDGMK